MRNSFASFIIRQAAAGLAEKAAVITGDLGFSVLEPIQEALKERYINAGVAEASMVSLAAALASDGYKVFTYSITPFATFRCLEQIRNDVCYHNLDVTVVGVGAGFGYGTLGATHHSVEDLSAVWAIPNIQVFSPADVREANACFEKAWTLTGPKYLRLGKGGEGCLSSGMVDFASNGFVLEYAKGTDLTIVSTGNVLAEVLWAREQLQRKGRSVQVLSCPWVKPLDGQSLVKKINSKDVIIVEELNPNGGFGSAVAREMLIRSPRRWNSVAVLSAPDRFASQVGGMAFQRRVAGLDGAAIVKFIESQEGSSSNE